MQGLERVLQAFLNHEAHLLLRRICHRPRRSHRSQQFISRGRGFRRRLFLLPFAPLSLLLLRKLLRTERLPYAESQRVHRPLVEAV